MLHFNEGKDLSLWELAITYECARGEMSSDQVIEKMKEIVRILQKSIQEGLRGTHYADRIPGVAIRTISHPHGKSSTARQRYAQPDHSIRDSHDGSKKFDGSYRGSTHSRILRWPSWCMHRGSECHGKLFGRDHTRDVSSRIDRGIHCCPCYFCMRKWEDVRQNAVRVQAWQLPRW